MQRDWELIRAILGKVEELPDTKSRLHARSLPGWAEDAVNYHFWLLIEAGLIERKARGSKAWQKHGCIPRCSSTASSTASRVRSASAPALRRNMVMRAGRQQHPPAFLIRRNRG